MVRLGGFVTQPTLPRVLWPDGTVEWRSRRGLLELDLILMPFYAHCYHGLSQEQKSLHQWLLSQNDMDLQQWLVFQKDVCSLAQDKRDWLSYVIHQVCQWKLLS